MDRNSIVFIADNNYAMPTAVAITSIKANKLPETKLDIRVIAVELTEEHRERLLSLASEDVSVSLIEAGDLSWFDIMAQKTAHVTKSALLKFVLPELLPDLDKALYMDGDLLVQADISELFDADLEGAFAAAVPDAVSMLVKKPSQLERLKIPTHPFYFNAGVMLLNLRKMREENIREQLMLYRQYGLNNFMDQDTFNVVFNGHVHALPVQFNFLTNCMRKLSSEKLSELYNETIPSQLYAAYRFAKIIHCVGAEKPWQKKMPYLTLLFEKYYQESPYGDRPFVLLEDIVEGEMMESLEDGEATTEAMDNNEEASETQDNNGENAEVQENNEATAEAMENSGDDAQLPADELSDESGPQDFWSSQEGYLLNSVERDGPKITIALTTVPARIPELRKMLVPLFCQTMKPDRVVLTLAEEDFPGLEADLPEELLSLRQHGLQILWAEQNLGPHNKYFSVMRNYPDDVVITVEDDALYDETLTETLYRSYQEFPHCVSALRTRIITFSEDGCVKPYKRWVHRKSYGTPDMRLLAVGVSGVLYPPHLLPAETFDADYIQKYTLTAEDLWLKIMELKAGIPVVLADSMDGLPMTDEAKERERQNKERTNPGENDACLYDMFEASEELIPLIEGIRKKTNTIVFITDNNYAMPTAVTITSIKANKRPETKLDIRVVAVELDEAHRERFLSLSSEDVSVSLIETDQLSRFDNVAQRTVHVSKSALFKFELPNLLPDQDKALYMDGDILVQQDLSDLLLTDVDDVYAAVVPDAGPMLAYSPSQLERLKITKHRYYFNSGVMLLNLQRMREKNISEKLLEYRISKLNYFMDQDALNVVFKDEVVYLSVKYDFITTMLERTRVTHKMICDLYNENLPTQPYAMYRYAALLHFASPIKPWLYQKPYLSLLYEKYYRQSPYADQPLVLAEEVDEEQLNKVQNRKTGRTQNILDKYLDNYWTENFWASQHGWLLNREEREGPKITISLTTFPARIPEIRKTLAPIFSQTLKPDRVVLTLTEEEFPGLEADLPENLLALRPMGLEINWVKENLRPHNKYFSTMQKYPDDIVITIDDDIKYGEALVETLYRCYQEFPNCVSALRTHTITFNDDGCLRPYRKWLYENSEIIRTPDMRLLATGVGGVLYPPHILPAETFDADFIRKYILKADDLWLKFMELKAGVPVVLATENDPLAFVGDSQALGGLCYENNDMNGNDACIYDLFEVSDEFIALMEGVREIPVEEETEAPTQLRAFILPGIPFRLQMAAKAPAQPKAPEQLQEGGEPQAAEEPKEIEQLQEVEEPKAIEQPQEGGEPPEAEEPKKIKEHKKNKERRKIKEAQEAEQPQESGEPKVAEEPQEIEQPQEAEEQKEIELPQESGVPLEAEEPQEIEQSQESGVPLEAEEPREIEQPQEAEETPAPEQLDDQAPQTELLFDEEFASDIAPDLPAKGRKPAPSLGSRVKRTLTAPFRLLKKVKNALTKNTKGNVILRKLAKMEKADKTIDKHTAQTAKHVDSLVRKMEIIRGNVKQINGSVSKNLKNTSSIGKKIDVVKGNVSKTLKNVRVVENKIDAAYEQELEQEKRIIGYTSSTLKNVESQGRRISSIDKQTKHLEDMLKKTRNNVLEIDTRLESHDRFLLHLAMKQEEILSILNEMKQKDSTEHKPQ